MKRVVLNKETLTFTIEKEFDGVFDKEIIETKQSLSINPFSDSEEDINRAKVKLINCLKRKAYEKINRIKEVKNNL